MAHPVIAAIKGNKKREVNNTMPQSAKKERPFDGGDGRMWVSIWTFPVTGTASRVRQSARAAVAASTVWAAAGGRGSRAAAAPDPECTQRPLGQRCLHHQ